MKVQLTNEEIREAVRAYLLAKGFTLAVPKKVNQNTGMVFTWGNSYHDKLSVLVDLKEKK